MTRFLLLYAWRDLSDRASWRSTLVVFLTLVAAVTAGLGGFGFTYGVDRVSRWRLDNDPFSRTLWTPGGVKGMIDVNVVDSLRAAAPEGTRVYPFYDVEIEFVRADGKTAPLPVRGRTLSFEAGAQDDLFSSRPVRPGGRSIVDSGDRGIVVTPQLLEYLGYDSKLPPPFLRGSYRDEMHQLDILGVTVEDLPLYHRFLIGDGYLEQLGSSFGSKLYPKIQTTALPDEWLRYHKKPPGEVIRAASNLAEVESPKAVVIKSTDKKKRKIWELELPPERTGLTVRRWRAIIRAMNDELQNATKISSSAAGLDVDTEGFETHVPERRLDYDFLAVVAATPDQVSAVANAIDKVKTPAGKLPINRDAVWKIERLNEQTRLMVAGVSMVELILVVIVAWNLLVIQAMRAASQTAEVGMLKVMGMSRPNLLITVVLEGLMLSVPAAAIGVLLGLGSTWAASSWWHDGDSEAIRKGFYWTWPLIGYVAGGAIALTLTCAALASRKSILASPSESLRAGR